MGASLEDLIVNQMVTEQFQTKYMESARVLAMLVLQSELYLNPEVKEEVDFILEFYKMKKEFRDKVLGLKKEGI